MGKVEGGYGKLGPVDVSRAAHPMMAPGTISTLRVPASTRGREELPMPTLGKCPEFGTAGPWILTDSMSYRPYLTCYIMAEDTRDEQDRRELVRRRRSAPPESRDAVVSINGQGRQDATEINH